MCWLSDRRFYVCATETGVVCDLWTWGIDGKERPYNFLNHDATVFNWRLTYWHKVRGVTPGSEIWSSTMKQRPVVFQLAGICSEPYLNSDRWNGALVSKPIMIISLCSHILDHYQAGFLGSELLCWRGSNPPRTDIRHCDHPLHLSTRHYSTRNDASRITWFEGFKFFSQSF